MKCLVIAGAGGHARVLAEAAVSTGWTIVGHVAPHPATAQVLGPYLGDDSYWPTCKAQRLQVALGLGFVDKVSLLARERVLAAVGLHGVNLGSVAHSSSIIASSASMLPGSFIAAGAFLGTGSELGRAGIINTGAIVDHDCVIGEGCHIGPGAVLSGGVEVGAQSLVGAGTVVIQGVRIGERAIVGAGSVVLADVGAHQTVAGSPARSL